MSGKTKEELQRMTAKEIKAYAKEIGCCLGYDASRKETAINAIMAYQEHNGMTVDLKFCPFCGGEAKSRGAFNELLNEVDGWYVYCTNDRCQCMPETVVYDTEEQAIAAWNARAALGNEPPYSELLSSLEADWHISASWDGLRKFWCIELTEEGARLRDDCAETIDRMGAENAKLRKLVYDMFEEFRYTPEACHWEAIMDFAERMRELGMEVER